MLTNGKGTSDDSYRPMSLWGLSVRELTEALVEIARAMPAPVVNVTVAPTPTAGERVVVTKHDAEGRILEFEKYPIPIPDAKLLPEPVDLVPEPEPVDPDRRAAVHEAAHAVAALYFDLPLSTVEIRTDGTGLTRYARDLGRREAQRWVITALAGPEAERDSCGGEPVEASDLRAIAAMADKLGLDLDDEDYGTLRARARHLVRRERARIDRVADALVQHRFLSGEDVVAAVAEVPAKALSRYVEQNLDWLKPDDEG
jgi:hypothetical protein